MRTWLIALLALAAPGLLQADDRRCIISFDAATLDACTGVVHPIHERLAPLADLQVFRDSPLRIVKFNAPVGLSQRQALERAGATILSYVPHYAYLVRMPASLDASVRTIDGVLWTGPYLPVWKLDINLARDIGRLPKGGVEDTILHQGEIDRLSIALHPGAEAAATRNALLATPGIELRQIEQAPGHERLVVGFDLQQIDSSVFALATHPEVASISLRWDHHFMNSQAGWLHQSGTNAGPNQLPIFEQGIFGCGQIIGAADSGLHAANCAFSDTSYGQPVTSVCSTGATCPPATPDFSHRKIGAHYKWSGAAGTAPADDHGHGTHVMGSILGNNPASPVDCVNYTSPGGLTNLDGTAPGAKLISQEMGAGLQYVNTLGGTLYHAAVTAYDNGARIHNNSWGSSCRNTSGVCIAGCQVEYRQTTRDADAAVWEFPELAVFVAAGNSGGLGGSSGCGPGADVGAAGNAKNVFSIASNQRGVNGNSMSGFSSRGPTQDRRSKPDLAAQGGLSSSQIISAARNACGTTGSQGTSMAAPTAAGLAALVREYLARGFYPSGTEIAGHGIPTPSAALIKAIMVNGAHEITGAGTTGGAPSQSQGWGRVHLDNALYFNGDARNLWLHDGTDGLQTTDVDTHVLTVLGGQPLIVTLTWHDAPATVNANPHTVNELRLEVEAPNGDVWTQKLPSTGGLTNPNPFQDTTTSNYDTLNNVHQIRLDAPQAGTYQVRVRAMQVAEGPQPYALAATGSISGLNEPDFALNAAPDTVTICAGDAVQFQIGVLGIEGFDDPVLLGISGLPAGATGQFVPSAVTPASPAATSTLSIGNTGAVSGGIYPLTILGNSNGPGFPAAAQSTGATLTVIETTPAAGSLIAPADGASGVSGSPSFSWSAITGAVDYRIQVATDAGFTNVVIDQVVSGTSFTPATALLPATTYHWRVAASNACGDGSASPAFSFSTSSALCSAPGLAIPDNNTTGISNALNVGSSGALESLQVELDINHTWVGDLIVTLNKGPTTINLVNRPGFTGTGFGCSGNDIDVTLSDSATLSIQSNCTSGENPTQAYIPGEFYVPAQALAAFVGEELSGTWTLNVSDRASGDTGTLNQWCLLAETGVSDTIFANDFECGPGLPDCVQPVTLNEGFEDISTLPGSGWILQNNSQPIGSTSWIQGASATMPAQAGSPDSYISANFNNAAGVGTISNWLVSPLLNFHDAASVSFWTRASGSGNFPDRLEIRACSGATCSNVGAGAAAVGDFTILLGSINPNLQIGDDPTGQNGYPYAAWAQFSYDQANGLPTSGTGRIAFRYHVTNSGPDGSNGSFIGIDTVSIEHAEVLDAPGGNNRGIVSGSAGSGTR